MSGPAVQAHPLVVLEREVPAAQGTMVLLHGRGADEHDLHGLFDVLDPEQRLRGITVGAPLRLPPGGKHWYVVPRVGFPDGPTFHHSYGELQRLLDHELGLEWSTTIVGGFSQGTVMSYALGLGEGRPAPAGILAFSGFIPTVEGWTPDLASRAGLPVFLAHGSMDPVISVEFAHQARELLEAGGAAVEVHETPMPHTIDPRVLPDAQAFVRRLVR
ncbi:phospholipase [Conexibacter sp. SYSU D00693]|uniref:alpha/beta hydrolase n=1 Tax=Conexibacter sp. SYSU D00693 TaxID=2812560 RepID=UPI001F11D7C7|nr:phospholipase [Conexibacter sp. SYSU D00693]